MVNVYHSRSIHAKGRELLPCFVTEKFCLTTTRRAVFFFQLHCLFDAASTILFAYRISRFTTKSLCSNPIVKHKCKLQVTIYCTTNVDTTQRDGHYVDYTDYMYKTSKVSVQSMCLDVDN